MDRERERNEGMQLLIFLLVLAALSTCESAGKLEKRIKMLEEQAGIKQEGTQR